MADAQPNPTRRLAIGILLIAAAAAAAVWWFGGRGRDEKAERATAPAEASASREAQPNTTAPPAAPVVSVLSRADLIAAAREAASAYAAGEPAPAAAAGLDGRRFSVEVAFGCSGPAAAGAASAGPFYTLGKAGETLKVTVRPEVWTASLFAQSLGGEDVEAVEGYWIPRPWRAVDGCSPRGADPLLAEAPQASQQTVGLATVFQKGSSRVARRGERPLELTAPLQEGAPPGAQGLRLVLEGRVTAFHDGRVAACSSPSPDQRPVCLIGARVERVAVRDPAADRELGEWLEASRLTPPTANSPAGSAAEAPRSSAR